MWSTIVRQQAGKKDDDVDSLIEDKKGKLASTIDRYNKLFKEKDEVKGQHKEKIQERQENYMEMVNAYYDIVTDFYEYGWGQSFHFAPRFQGESFAASIARHEHYLAARLGLKPGMKAIDVGCGVGGPMREIAKFCGASIVGVNNNDYQIQRSNILCKRQGLDHLCKTQQADFMSLPFKEGHFDAAYAIEATCHAPDKVGCFSQMFKVLKPGGCFAGYEWCMTDKYDSNNKVHRDIKHKIEHGDSLPDLVHTSVVVQALKDAGFEVLEHFDVAVTALEHGNDVGWYTTLQGGCSLSQLKHSRAGRMFTQQMVDTMELLSLAPKGTSATHKMLCIGADGLAAGGATGIFTPMFFFLARKPLNA